MVVFIWKLHWPYKQFGKLIMDEKGSFVTQTQIHMHHKMEYVFLRHLIE